MPARLRLTPPRTRWWDLWPLVLADCGGDAPVVLQGCERLGSLCTAEAESQSLDVVGSRGVTADLDGDGIRDLVSTGSGLSITWSRSDHREYLLFPEGVPDAEIGDVDSDGDLDVVFITGEPSTLRVLANEGTRRLVEQPAVMLPGRAHGLWIGQLDGDETLDAVVASGAPGGKGELTVFTAGLTRRETITVGHKPIAVEAADLDGDGRLDLVAADFDESVLHIVLANGAGFAPPRQVLTGPEPTVLQLYDLDGDGQLDVLTHGQSPAIWWHRGDGAGALAAPHAIEVQNHPSNGFGAHRDEQGRRWLMMLDDGHLVASELDETDKVVRRVVAGGIQDSYRLDMDAGSPLTNGSWYGYRHSLAPSHVFTELRHGGDNSYTLALGDLDQDGGLELVSLEGNAIVARGLAEGSWDEPRVLVEGTGWVTAIIVTDATDDGVPDLVIGDGAPSVSVAVGVGDGSFNAPGPHVPLRGVPRLLHAVPGAPGEAPAITVGGTDSPGVVAYRFDGEGAMIDTSKLLATGLPRTLASADLDADGLADLVALVEDADGSASLVIVPRVASGWGPARTRSLADVRLEAVPDKPLQNPLLVLGDVDLDDRTDAVLVASSAVVHLLDIGAEDPPAPQLEPYPGLHYPDALALADIDGEGPLDLVTCSFSGLQVLLLSTAGALDPQAPHDQFITACTLHADPDGQATAATATDRGLSLLRPDFAPALARTDIFEGGPGYFADLATGDLDADGKSDVVVSDRPYGPAGSTAVLWGHAVGEPGRATWQAGQLFETATIAVAPLDDRPGDELVTAWSYGFTEIWTAADGGLQRLATVAPKRGYEVQGVGVARRAGRPSDVILLCHLDIQEWGLLALPRAEDGNFIADAEVVLWSTSYLHDETPMVIADFDGDGHDDIAVHSGTLEGVVLVWGDPERTPTVTTIPVSVAASSHLAVADLDGDGAPELLVGTMQGVLQIAFAGREPGRPQTVLRRSADRGLLAADLDADGNTDIVAASDEGVDILLRSPDFLTEPLGLWLPRPRAVDLDGDQILDLIGVGGAAVMTYRSGQPAAPQPDDSVSP